MHDTVNSKFRFLSRYKIVCAGLLTLVLIVGLTDCSTKKLNEINLMPAPDVYAEIFIVITTSQPVFYRCWHQRMKCVSTMNNKNTFWHCL